MVYMQSVKLPAEWKLAPALQFASELASLPEATIYSLDFTDVQRVTPFGMLYIAQAIDALRQRFPGCRFSEPRIPARNQACGYAGWMGFFDACGFDYGKKTGQAPGSQTYVPVTARKTSELLGSDSIGQTSTNIAARLARQLTQAESGPLIDAFTYSLSEIIRNVGEHSQSTSFSYCAQYWPSESRVEIALIDNGIGLFKSLSANPYLEDLTEESALRLALLPGVSGKAFKGGSSQSGVWGNSGFGLFINYKLCSEGGSFMICSGSKGLLYEHGQENSASHEANLQGTALQLIMDTSKLDDIAKKLEEFHEQGLSIARATRKGFIPPRMQMSSMLRNGLIDPNELVVDQSVVHDQFGPGKIIEFTDAPHGRLAQVQFKTGRVKRVLVQTLTPTWENEH